MNRFVVAETNADEGGGNPTDGEQSQSEGKAGKKGRAGRSSKRRPSFKRSGAPNLEVMSSGLAPEPLLRKTVLPKPRPEPTSDSSMSDNCRETESGRFRKSASFSPFGLFVTAPTTTLACAFGLVTPFTGVTAWYEQAFPLKEYLTPSKVVTWLPMMEHVEGHALCVHCHTERLQVLEESGRSNQSHSWGQTFAINFQLMKLKG